MSFVYPTFPECGGAPECSICSTLDAMAHPLQYTPYTGRYLLGVWCEREQHDRCRSGWGARPCRCKCHGAKPSIRR